MSQKYINPTGQRIKAAVKAANITQKELARKLGYSPNYISQIVCGTRRLPTEMAKKIASVTGVRAVYLLGNDDFMKTQDLVDYILDEIESKRVTGRYVIAFLSCIARQCGAKSLRYEASKPGGPSAANEGFFIVEMDSGTARIPEAETSDMIEDLLEIAEALLQRLFYTEMRRDRT